MKGRSGTMVLLVTTSVLACASAGSTGVLESLTGDAIEIAEMEAAIAAIMWSKVAGISSFGSTP